MHNESQRSAMRLVVMAVGTAGAILWSPVASAQQKPLAADEHQVGGVRVELLEVKRTAVDAVNVKWRYVNTTKDEKTVSVLPARDNHYRIAENTYLVDNVNKKKHLVIHDAEDRPVAASHEVNHPQHVVVGGGQTLSTWAKFPAPPADVTKVSVVIPGVPPFEDVPISQ